KDKIYTMEDKETKGLDDVEYDESADEYLDEYLNDEGEGSGGHHVKSTGFEKSTSLMEKAKQSLIELKAVVKESGWKKILSQKGTTVYSKQGTARNDRLPIFMGQCEIRGFSPLSVFTIIGRKRLWDDWYRLFISFHKLG
ncbi:4989_t:CDS:1, partial [Scutellospora calospora]